MENIKPDNEFRIELALIAYKGIFSDYKFYEKAIEYYRQSTSCNTVSAAIAQMCFRAADAFIKEMNKNNET